MCCKTLTVCEKCSSCYGTHRCHVAHQALAMRSHTVRRKCVRKCAPSCRNWATRKGGDTGRHHPMCAQLCRHALCKQDRQICAARKASLILIGRHWLSLPFTRLQVSLGLSGSHSASLSLKRPHWLSLGLTGSHCASLAFPGAHWLSLYLPGSH